MQCCNAVRWISSQNGDLDENQIIPELIHVKNQLCENFEFFTHEQLLSDGINEQQKHFIGKLSTYMGTSVGIAYMFYNEYLKQNGISLKHGQSLFSSVSRTQLTMEEVRKIYWKERISMIQLYKIASAYWHDVWSTISDCIFALTNMQSHNDLTDMLIKSFQSISDSINELVKSSFFHSKTTLECSVDAKFFQLLHETQLILEAILIGLSDASLKFDHGKLFSNILDAFWKTSYFSKKEFSCLSAGSRQLVEKIRNLQCFILIRATHLDDVRLFSSDTSPFAHFMSEQHHRRLLASMSGLGGSRGDGVLLLFAAICGSSFANRGENADFNILCTAARYANTAINNLAVFAYLLDILSSTMSPSSSSAKRVQTTDLLVLPDSLSVVSLCEHTAVFDLLTFMARDIAIESLDVNNTKICDDEDDSESVTISNRSLFIQLLSKCLSVMVQCSGSMHDGNESSNIGIRVAPIINDVTQQFPYNLDFLNLCISLLNSTANNNNKDMTHLVTQLISSVPFFAQPFTQELASIIHVDGKACDDENGDGETDECSVMLTKQHWALPIDVIARKSHNQYAISMPVGTRGCLKPETDVIVWQHEYPIWPVVNAIISAADQTLTREFADYCANTAAASSSSVSTFLGGKMGGIGGCNISASSSECSAGGSISAKSIATSSALNPLQQIVSRLGTCLDFVDVCLTADIDAGRCLTITDLVWKFVTRIFTDFFSGSNAGTESYSGKKGHHKSAGDAMASLTVEQLFPRLLRLTTHSMVYAHRAGNGSWKQKLTAPHPLAALFAKYSGNIFSHLQTDRILLPVAVSPNTFPQPQHSSTNAINVPKYGLSDCCFLRFVSPTATLPSLGVVASSGTIFRLVSGYLDLAINLLTVEKTAYLVGDSSDGVEISFETSNVNGKSPLCACLIFCLDLLLEICQTGGGISCFSTSSTTFHSLREVNGKMGLFCLVNKALLFFVELLTSYQAADSLPNNDDDAAEFANRCLKTCPSNFRELQIYAHRLLITCEPVISCLISLTTVPIASLQIPAYSTEFDFLQFSTKHHDGQLSSTGQHGVQSTWLSLTLVHLLFPVDSSTTTTNHPPPSSILLRALCDVQLVQQEPYLFKILSFIDLSCSTGLARAAVNVLKKMVQFPQKLITPFLNCMPPRLTSLVMQRLISPTEDQVTRAGLFDWLAEAVLFDALQGPAGPPFHGPGFTLLRILATPSAPLSTPGITQTIEMDLWTGVFSTLEEVNVEFRETPVGIGVTLYWSVVKFIAAIWMQPANPFRVHLIERPTFWKTLSEPFFALLDSFKDSKFSASTVEMEITGYMATIISIELYENLKFATSLPENFSPVCAHLIESNIIFSWTKVAFRCLSVSRALKKEEEENNDNEFYPVERDLNSLAWSLMRWKTLLCVLLRWASSCKKVDCGASKLQMTKEAAADILRIWVEKALCLVSLPKSVITISLLDQLAVCMTSLASNFPGSTMPGEFIDLFPRAVELLEKTRMMSPPRSSSSISSSTVFSHFHSDLLVLTSLLLPPLSRRKSMSGVEKPVEHLLFICFEFIRGISVQTRITTADRNTFIQSVNILERIWTHFDTAQLLIAITESGILNNLLILLGEHSRARSGADFCKTVLHFLFRLLAPCQPSAASSTAKGIYPDLSIFVCEASCSSTSAEENVEELETSRLQLKQAELIASCSDLLALGLRLPPTEKLMQWLAQDEVCEEFPVTIGGTPSISVGAWFDLVLSQLRLLTVLSHYLGGPGHCNISVLITDFLLENHEQLTALVGWWNVEVRGERLEPFADLIEGGQLKRHRIALAEAVFELYWCVIRTSQAHHLIEPTCQVALAALFKSGRSDSKKFPSNVASITLPVDIWMSVYCLVVEQTQICALLLLRPGTPELPAAESSSFRPGENRTATCSESIGSCFGNTNQPLRTRVSASEIHLLPLIKLLASCLRLLTVNIPLLGSLSFASASEIATLTPVTALNFSTPSLNTSPTLTFGTLFSLARSSSQLLVNNCPSTLTEDGLQDSRFEFTASLTECNEIVFAIIYSQATVWLLNPRIGADEKHLLTRGLSVEFQSYNFIGRSTSRRNIKFRAGQTSRSGRVQSPFRSANPLNPLRLTSECCDEETDGAGPTWGQTTPLHRLAFLACSERFFDFVK